MAFRRSDPGVIARRSKVEDSNLPKRIMCKLLRFAKILAQRIMNVALGDLGVNDRRRDKKRQRSERA